MTATEQASSLAEAFADSIAWYEIRWASKHIERGRPDAALAYLIREAELAEERAKTYRLAIAKMGDPK